MTNAWDDPRIARGMEKQLSARRARIAAGEKPLGWKVGLGAPPAMERLKIKAPLVGFMMQKSLLPNRVTVPVASWTKPVAEPEVAIYMGQDLPGGGKHQGKEEALQTLQKAVGSWDEFSLSMDEFVEDGDTVVALGHSNVKKGDKSAELPVVHILRFDGDQLKRLQILTDTHEANKVLGGS